MESHIVAVFITLPLRLFKSEKIMKTYKSVGILLIFTMILLKIHLF